VNTILCLIEKRCINTKEENYEKRNFNIDVLCPDASLNKQVSRYLAPYVVGFCRKSGTKSQLHLRKLKQQD
jgi:hypothetical protein